MSRKDEEPEVNRNAPVKGQRPDFWRIVHSKDSPNENMHILNGDYDEHIEELHDMCLRHGPELLQACRQRMVELEIEIPSGSAPAQQTGNDNPKPFTGFRPKAPTPKTG